MLWSCQFNVQTTNDLSLQKPFEQLPRMSMLIIKHADSFVMAYLETRIYIYIIAKIKTPSEYPIRRHKEKLVM